MRHIFNFFALFIVVIGDANAVQICAKLDTPIYSDRPIADSKARRAVGIIKKGERYDIVRNDGLWAAIKINAKTRWAERVNLEAEELCPIPANQKTTKSAKPPSPAHAMVQPRASASNCACNSRNSCVGPRGGRYCITSSGNRRYVR